MPATLRPAGPLARHRGTLLAATIVTAAVVVLKQKSTTVRDGELSQTAPNFYVTVDRSGGGV
ncbi:hypothetical protein F5X68DRAFT_58063 [Plectosphaerella plurivora]|uniref:Uncharacterized protein n=1 Tax=Plectosphaerella plurivora TaxID=936078 RepID=A0A9P9AE29_9PEZI|nr:hypothetical protein F5X68DRAFT_58063 [Plectosphaerella plurivora]